MTGKKQNLVKPQAEDATAYFDDLFLTNVVAKPDKADTENAKVQMQDVHFQAIKSPRDAASGGAKS